MADGEATPTDPGEQVPPPAPEAPITQLPTVPDPPGPTPPHPPVWTAAGPGPRAANPDWKSLFATWPTHIQNGLNRLGRWLAALGRGVAKLGGRLARLTEIKLTPLQKIALLGALAVVSIFGALAFSGNALGQACVVAFVPGLSLAIGILGTRWRSGQDADGHLSATTQNALHAALQLRRTVRYVDEHLSKAHGHMESGNQDGALIEVVRAKTATELSLGAADQLSPPRAEWSGGAQTQSQAALIAGSVARVEDEHTLIINRGAEHGATPDMVFAVMSAAGDQILDPESGAVIGELPTEKLRVKVVEVQPKYSRAVTFRTYAPARVDYPAFSGFARLASGPDLDPGAFDSIDESISRMLDTELGDPEPVREKIANARKAGQKDSPVSSRVRVDIGDQVRQVH